MASIVKVGKDEALVVLFIDPKSRKEIEDITSDLFKLAITPLEYKLKCIKEN